MRKAFVLINSELGHEADLQSRLKKIEGVVGVYVVYGVYDLMVEVAAESELKLKDVVFSEIRTLEHVKSTLTLTTA